MSLTGYKIAFINNNKRVLVTLEIGDDANTNLYRSDIVDKMYAKYRCDKATVVAITPCDTEENRVITCAYTAIYKNKRIKYVIGEEVVERSYNKDINLVYGEGIHFFLSKEVALLYGVDRVDNGEYKQWYDNGQLYIQTTCVKGKLHGEYKSWYNNGQLMVQTTFVKDKPHGEYKEWLSNGQLYKKYICEI